MADSKGRPTGLLFGYLRSLSALKNRFENHSVYVVWDGSKQRRKSRYEGYKAQRNTENIFLDGQIDTLRTALPLLGVTQAYNLEEEADDVIASLVRGPLEGNLNIMVSTDHDFLQLVSYTTQLLVPKVGAGSEKIYDTDRVIEEYGVPPSKMVELRSLLGDTSDNLPGVPTVRDKVLKGMLRTYGTVEGIYASHMAGLTPKEYDKLKASKAQVLLNRELMALQNVPISFTEPTPNEDGVRELLTQYDIQPDSILEPFFKIDKGFVKTT
jgi:DNA polymerase-1